MTDLLIVLLVLLVFGLVLAGVSTTYPRPLRRWLAIAFASYVASAAAQLFFTRVIVQGGDTQLYAMSGAELARLLERDPSGAGTELVALFFQQPSVFDALVYGGGRSNTGSMHAICGAILFLVRGSSEAAHVFVAMVSLCGALGLFRAFRQFDKECPPAQLFATTVLIPSVPFWTSALHKEAFCLAGTGALFAGWAAIHRGAWLRAALWLPVGGVLVFLFRAPAIVPLVSGLALYFVLNRAQKIRGARAAAFLTPAYFAVALAGLVTPRRRSSDSCSASRSASSTRSSGRSSSTSTTPSRSSARSR